MSETTRRDTFSWSARPTGVPRLDALAPSSAIAGRYELLTSIGRGGEGEVWRARDRLTDQLVAVKLLNARPDREIGRVRREVTALRWLRLPGVVSLRDDGVEGLRYFIVMDLVEGAPFPGLARPVPWAELAPAAMALLEVLARVHHAGVVHRDLKPSNVLVRADGRPVVLDFGVATGRTLAPTNADLGLTPLYAAPEQLLGRPCDARADLYAVGVMLFEALTGQPTHGQQRDESIRRRLAGERPDLAGSCPDLPSTIADVIHQLLCFDPAGRPTSAVEVVALLGGDALAVIQGRGLEPVARASSHERLRPLFRGPDAFFHLAEDAAVALFERTGGEPGRVRQEIAAWVRAGLAWWDDDKLVLDRQSIDRLAAGLPLVIGAEQDETDLGADENTVLATVRIGFPTLNAARLRERLSWTTPRVTRAISRLSSRDLIWPLPGGRLGAQPRVGATAVPRADVGDATPNFGHNERSLLALLVETQRAAEEQLASGHLPRAAALLEQGLLLARQSPNQTSALAEREAELLRLYCVVSLAEESVAGVERALYALERAVVSGDDIDAWIWLLHGWRAALRRESERALALLDALPTLPDGELEIWRQGGRVRAASALGEPAELRALEALSGWAAGNEAREARLAGWMGNLRYRQNRFGDALGLHLQSARRKRRPDARLASLVNATMAAIEGLHNDQALVLAEEARSIAVSLRHAAHEAVAVWALRHGAYRAGERLALRSELPDAAARLGAWHEGIHAFSEAGIAWRQRAPDVASAMARRAARCFAMLRMPDMARLMEALDWTLRGDAPRRALDALADPAIGGDVPDLVVQTLGLLHLCTPDPDPAWGERARSLSRCRPRVEWTARLDLVSFDEVMRMVEGGWDEM